MRAARGRTARRGAAARRHRIGQDRGLPAGDRAGAGAWAGRDRAGARDRADAADGRPLPGPVRRHRGGAAQRAHPGPARRRAPPHRRRRGAGRRGRPLGGVRGRARPGRDRGGRGARRLLQARERSPLRRPPRRRQARPAGGRPGRVRQRHAAAGVLARHSAPDRATRARGRAAAGGRDRRPAPRRRLPADAAAARRAGRIEDAGGRAILLQNRRGSAAAIHCRSCGHGWRCPRCDVSLSLHGGARLVCHHCGHSERPPRACPECGSVDLTRIGSGTRAVEDELGDLFPALSVLRLDADVAAAQRRAGGHAGAVPRAPTGRCWWARSWWPRGTTCPASRWRRCSTPRPGWRCPTSAPRSARSPC